MIFGILHVRNYKGIFYSEDGLQTLNLMEDETVVHSKSYSSIRWTGNFHKHYERLLNDLSLSVGVWC